MAHQMVCIVSVKCLHLLQICALHIFLRIHNVCFVKFLLNFFYVVSKGWIVNEFYFIRSNTSSMLWLASYSLLLFIKNNVYVYN